MTAPTVDRAALRAELEATRSAYHALLAQIDDADWARPDTRTRRTVGEDMVHIVSYLGNILPLIVGAARQGKKHALPPLPPAIGHPFSYLLTKLQSRGQSRQTVGAKYEAAHQAALQLLDGIQEREWPLATNSPAGRRTIAEAFRHHTTHFDEHATAIRQAVRRR
jgi:hypothetical protein